MLSFKLILVIVGIVLSVIGLVINNWKLAVIGNSIALATLIFPNA